MATHKEASGVAMETASTRTRSVVSGVVMDRGEKKSGKTDRKRDRREM